MICYFLMKKVAKRLYLHVSMIITYHIVGRRLE